MLQSNPITTALVGGWPKSYLRIRDGLIWPFNCKTYYIKFLAGIAFSPA